ncbi:glutathione S-transferase N-terminal domain-containing protein [Maritalea mediterranea]|uniref:Glutathione S-transferase N-terminal domain-containing protein n=1 Tax=Maritalea mediterranea TaxID=2909667 RepID=A0ABS9E882_9HYPH|nr:glutathione S-transferase N-terminal domain-containing protein [Maritalea mediterranea]MCF4099013.1 glutathione S-transferase N-terminal domain-containing protein [Maritalea mediterranea]
MKLLISHASPYARKCRVTALEKGIADIEEVHVSPLDEPEKLNHLNPLGKIPCLIYGENKTLFDSPVICAYFDEIGEGPRLMPQEGDAHWAMRRHEALFDGILDSALNIVTDIRKPQEQHSAQWQQRWGCAIDRGLSQAQNELDKIEGDISTAQIALACAIGYVQFRLRDHDWLSPYSYLKEWHDEFAQRPSMRATEPK